MKTLFQMTLSYDRDTCWEIVKIFHPELNDKYKDKMKVYQRSYDWVSISFKIKGYGIIDICIDNGKHGLTGGKISKQHFIDAHINDEVDFDAWLIILDCKQEEYNRDKCSEKVAKLLKNRGYETQSSSEMYKIYYED